MKLKQHEDFLLEIGAGELPPKDVDGLVSALATNIEDELKALSFTYKNIKTFTSPRRLAVLVSEIPTEQPSQLVSLRGPKIDIAFDGAGAPTTAAIKFAASCGVGVEKLSRIEDKKGTYLFYQAQNPGQPTISLLPDLITKSIKNLPIKRHMYWGDNIGPFIRPVHWLLAMFGKDIVPVELFKVISSNKTHGHRFHHPEPIAITLASEYEKLLEQTGHVIADPQKRREQIRAAIEKITPKNGRAIIADDLLNEVVNLVEHPTALLGTFGADFLKIPQEVLITTFKNHQKYFPVVDAQEKLLPNFILISNIKSTDTKKIVDGNEKVVKARFSDAAYFYHQDIKRPLLDRLEKLKNMSFLENLGSLYEKTKRLIALTRFIATKIGSNTTFAEQAAKLSKCDLETSMVWEFPELQGIMGYHYALQDFDVETATAIKDQYLPRFSGDELPATKTGCALAIADRIDTLVGTFAINKIPTGDKDPLGLRRAAAGLLRIVIEKSLDLDLEELINQAIQSFGNLTKQQDLSTKITCFIYERLHQYCLELEIHATAFQAVLAKLPTRPLDFIHRARAVNKFMAMPQAEALLETYKRIRNILDKAAYSGSTEFNSELVTEKSELDLVAAIKEVTAKIHPLYEAGEYLIALEKLMELQEPLESFFNTIIVMDENPKKRQNRLAILQSMRELFELIADLSCVVSGKARL